MTAFLEQQGYVLDPHFNIWSKPTYEGINYSDGDEVERRIGCVIDQACDITVLSPELRQYCTDWATVYHLSGTRANILRPFETSLHGDILEIGAGCGAITRYLGECKANVLALEGSPRRAAIARSRTRDLLNVTVVAEKFDDFECDHKFDMITLIGVLEYANLFTSAENPALAMLARVRSLLKPNGKLIIAIENQLGLKYFAGALEDHLGKAMYGIEGRYRNDQPQTFGRKALRDLLVEAGFKTVEFLAPFPDYKLPVSIVTEEGMETDAFDAAAFAWQSARRDPQLPPHCTFSLELAWPEIFRNELGMDVANSFLIAASPESMRVIGEEILAFHYSSDRIPQYWREAQFLRSATHGIDVIYKRPYATHENENAANTIQFDCPDSAQYISGSLLSWEFVQTVTKDGWTIDDVAQFLKRYVLILETLASKTDLLSLSGNLSCATLPGEFFDFIPQNIIIRNDGTLGIIDKEWTLRREVELSHLLFRAILLMIGSVTRFGENGQGISYSRIGFVSDAFNSIGITLTDKEYSRFLDLESLIQEQVTGRPRCEFQIWWPEQPLPTHNLSQAMVVRDQQVAQLIQATSELENRISSLNQTIESLNQTLSDSHHHIEVLDQRLNERSAYIAGLLSSRSWRITAPLRFLNRQVSRVTLRLRILLQLIQQSGGVSAAAKKVISVIRREGVAGLKRRVRFPTMHVGASVEVNPMLNRNDYTEWVNRYDTIDDVLRNEIRLKIGKMFRHPKISVLMPVYDPPLDLLDRAIYSVRNQLYPHWELCIADDASRNHAVRDLLARHAKEDARVHLVFRTENGHISRASNSALELATGEFIALLDNDDLLPEHALYHMAEAILANPDVGLIYSDEDKIDLSGNRYSPYFKPDWNPDLFLSHNMVCHLAVYRKSLVSEVGGFREGYEGAQDYDLALRCSERLTSKDIVHIPKILYHWRSHPGSTALAANEKNYALAAGERALNDHLARKGVAARAELLHFGMYRVRYFLPALAPMVSLIIPTRNGLQLIKQCVGSILAKTSYVNYEIIIVDNGSDDPATLRYFSDLAKDERIRILRDDRPFNYSALNNAAVREARGEYVALINNDIEVITPDWLSEMVSLAIQPMVGAVGSRLWYPNETLQHAGVITGIGGVAGHSHKYLPKGHFGYFGRASLIQAMSVVTAACLLIKKEIYEKVGGLNEDNLRVAFNDVDFCLRVRQAGYRNIWTPFAELYHHESATRGHEDTPEKKARFKSEVQYMQQQWGDSLLHDPAYNPNLTLEYEDFSLAWPPRRTIYRAA